MAKPLPTPTHTVTYTSFGDLHIGLDLYSPPSTKLASIPVIVYYHAGGLVTGSKSDIFLVGETLKTCMEKGVAFVSVNYPLLSPFTGRDLVASVKSVFAYITSSNFSAYLPGNADVDPEGIAVIGSSGGGYLARLCAVHAEPRPKAVCLAYGMGGDMLLDFWFGPMALPTAKSDRDVMPVPPFLDPAHPTPRADLPVYVDEATGLLADKLGAAVAYAYFLQEGKLLDYLTGSHGLSVRLAKLSYEQRVQLILELGLDDLFPQLQVTSSWPATVLFHGDEDNLVPVEESRKTYDQLTELGVKAELIVIPGGNHAFMHTEKGGLSFRPESDECYARSLAFILGEIGG